jgi:hypothetical protein
MAARFRSRLVVHGSGKLGDRGRRDSDLRQGADETISPARDGFDKPRSVGGVAQDGPKPGNGISNAMLEIHKSIGRPELRPQLLSGDELAGRPQKDCQHLQRTPLDRQTHTRTAQHSSLEIQLEGSEADCLTRILLHRAISTP